MTGNFELGILQSYYQHSWLGPLSLCLVLCVAREQILLCSSMNIGSGDLLHCNERSLSELSTVGKELCMLLFVEDGLITSHACAFM